MKLLHTGDLHIGKNLNNFNLLDDQAYILDRITAAALQYKVDGVIIAGDLYDRSVPPAEAVSLVDSFITTLVDNNISIFCVGGNHDSPERISFASSVLQKNGFYIESVLDSQIKKIELRDSYGKLNIYMLPYLREAYLKDFCKNHYQTEIKTMDEGIACLMAHTPVNKEERNLLVTHYFVTDAGILDNFEGEKVQIPEKELGGAGNVDASRFLDFDYVALGHVHGYMRIGKGMTYYSGSPLKYSFREVNQKKGFIILEINEKEKGVTREFVKLQPKHDLRKIEGRLEQLISKEVVESADTEDYIYAVLTDEGSLFDPFGRLKVHYPNLMHVGYKRDEEAGPEGDISLMDNLNGQNPVEVFESFYKDVVGEEPGREFVGVVEEVVKKLKA